MKKATIIVLWLFAGLMIIVNKYEGLLVVGVTIGFIGVIKGNFKTLRIKNRKIAGIFLVIMFALIVKEAPNGVKTLPAQAVQAETETPAPVKVQAQANTQPAQVPVQVTVPAPATPAPVVQAVVQSAPAPDKNVQIATALKTYMSENFDGVEWFDSSDSYLVQMGSDGTISVTVKTSMYPKDENKSLGKTLGMAVKNWGDYTVSSVIVQANNNSMILYHGNDNFGW